MKREYELRDGDEVVATLSCRGSFNPTSRFARADGRWEFRQAGLWGLHTVILAEGSNSVVAMLHRSAWHAGGRIEIPGAQELRAKSNFTTTRLEFQDMSGHPIVRCDRFRGLLRKSADLRLAPDAANRSELPWLAGLIWHLVLRVQEDAGAAAGAAAAVGAAAAAG